MNGLFEFVRLYDQEDGAGDPPEGDKLPESWTQAQQDEFNKRALAMRKSAAEKAKAEAKAELEAAQQQRVPDVCNASDCQEPAVCVGLCEKHSF